MPNTAVKQFGNRVLRTRKSKGLTQAQLAELAGISTRTVQRIEKAKSVARFSTALRLSNALNVEIQDLVESANWWERDDVRNKN